MIFKIKHIFIAFNSGATFQHIPSIPIEYHEDKMILYRVTEPPKSTEPAEDSVEAAIEAAKLLEGWKPEVVITEVYYKDITQLKFIHDNVAKNLELLRRYFPNALNEA